MYDDNSRLSVKKMKMEMSLDLANGQTNPKLTKLSNEVLGTPDLGIFMLSSPDLERFIIQQNGLVLTTPTPTSQILFPRSVTEEQEAYARGFVDALGELHKNYGTPAVSSSSGAPSTGFKSITIAQPLTTVTSLPGGIATHSKNAMKPKVSAVQIQPQVTFVPKLEKAQTVPSLRHVPATVPINMDDQETAKLERKRARNRLAATRCRNRKLERISRLEDRVKELKGQNSDLADTAATLREQVFQLKQSILEHTQNGCQVMISHNLL